VTGFRGGGEDIVLRFSELLIDAGFDQQKISNVADTVRHEYDGSRVYVKKYDPLLDKRVLESLKRCGNVSKVAQEMSLHKTTVYKIIRRRGK